MQGDLLLVLKMHIFRRSPNLRLLLVLPYAVEVNESQYTQAHAITHDDSDLS
jgi:hypothetical protein